MKFNCGLTAKEKRIARQAWHRWFAWRPVRVGKRDCRWLEYVERKVNWQMWHDGSVSHYPEYRALTTHINSAELP